MINKYDKNRNAYIYACENERVEMLRMMIDIFKVNIDQKYDYCYIDDENHCIIKECTGFINACENDNLKIVKILVDKYPSIIEQRHKFGLTGFMYACTWNRPKVV